MKAVDLQNVDMSRRVARFKELKPYKNLIMDETGVPAEAIEMVSAKNVYPVMSPEGWKGRNAIAPVKGAEGLTLSLVECPPGNMPGLHIHSHAIENFFCLGGRFRISWGAEGEDSVIVDKFDFVSVPAGVYRNFECISEETGYLLAIIQTPTGDARDEVVFHPHVGEEIAAKFGAEVLETMDGIGFRIADRAAAE